MDLCLVLLALGIILITHLSLSHVQKSRRSHNNWLNCDLPGPESRGGRLFGSLWDLVVNYKKPMVLYTRWAEEFGGIYKLKIGSKFVIVVSSVEWFGKVFAKTGTKLSYRVRDNVLSLVIGSKGLVTSDGDLWKHHRKFTFKSFRDLEMGKEGTHDIIYDQTCILVDHVRNKISELDKLQNHVQQGYNPQLDIGVGIFNILWCFVTGKTYPLEYSRVREIVRDAKAEMRAAEIGGPWNFSNVLGIIWMTLCNPIKLLGSYLKRHYFVRDEILKIKNELQDSSMSKKSVIQMYLEVLASRVPELKELSESHLSVYVSDLVVAGVETTYSSIRWTLLYLAANPDCMKKLQVELDNKSKENSLYDLTSYQKCREDLPYTEAVILESLRIRPVIHTFCHTTLEDIPIDDFQIPKDTWVIGNVWGIHHDKSIWNDPEVFRPERFLNESGSEILKSEVDKCLVFSTGARKCVGEQLSRVELHAFIVALCINFDIWVKDLPPSYKGEEIFEPQVGISLIPPDNEILFRKRVVNIP